MPSARVDYRREIMSAMHEQAAILGEMASNAIPKDRLGANLQITAMLASTALKAFEPKVPGGQSVPDIWSDRDDFSKRMRSFSEKTAQAAKNAPSMAPEAALASMLDGLDCKSCHQVYRDETK